MDFRRQRWGGEVEEREARGDVRRGSIISQDISGNMKYIYPQGGSITTFLVGTVAIVYALSLCWRMGRRTLAVVSTVCNLPYRTTATNGTVGTWVGWEVTI